VIKIESVIFDFHSTLVDGGEPDAWIDAALGRLGRPALPGHEPC